MTPQEPNENHRSQGVVRDERGQEQPADNRRARQRTTTGRNAQRDPAENKPLSPGEPAGGE